MKLVSNPSAGDARVPKMADIVKKKNWVVLNLIFMVLRCISNQKINEYWQISIWLSQLALYNSYVKWRDLGFKWQVDNRAIKETCGILVHNMDMQYCIKTVKTDNSN